MPISVARENLASVIETAQNEEVFLERHGKPMAVVISPEYFAKLQEALKFQSESQAKYEEFKRNLETKSAENTSGNRPEKKSRFF